LYKLLCVLFYSVFISVALASRLAQTGPNSRLEGIFQNLQSGNLDEAVRSINEAPLNVTPLQICARPEIMANRLLLNVFTRCPALARHESSPEMQAINQSGTNPRLKAMWDQIR